MKLAVVAFPGSNKDVYESLKEVLHLEAELISWNHGNLDSYDGIILSGGASYGDYLRPGAIAAVKEIMQEVKKQAEKGKTILGIGNGFQVLTEAGLLPGALLPNETLLFISGKQELVVENNQTPFTTKYKQGEVVKFPIAHGYGNYYCDEETLQTLKDNNQIVFTYQTNPNGSSANIAGITNKEGNILGMMPHPERAMEAIFGSEDGIRLFESLVENGGNAGAN